MDHTANTHRIDRLLDAIELVKAEQHGEAQGLLRELIREDNDFEDAWLWMSVAVGSLDQSELCLDNVLRVNPNNLQAASALFRLRETEMLMEKLRTRLRLYRDVALMFMWIVFIGSLYAALFSML